jgi:hypothetical protein
MLDSTRPRIFVACGTFRHNLPDLERFGEVVVLTNKSIFPDWGEDQVSAHADMIISKIHRMGYKSDKDFIVLTGDPIWMGCLAAYAFNEARDKVRFLKFDAKENAYYKVDVPVKVIGEEANEYHREPNESAF